MTLAEHARSWRERGLGQRECRNLRPEQVRKARAAARLRKAEVALVRMLLGVSDAKPAREGGFRTLEALMSLGSIRQYLDACKAHGAKVRAWPRTRRGRVRVRDLREPRIRTPSTAAAPISQVRATAAGDALFEALTRGLKLAAGGVK